MYGVVGCGSLDWFFVHDVAFMVNGCNNGGHYTDGNVLVQLSVEYIRRCPEGGVP